MTEDVRSQFAQGYLKNMITDKDGNIVGVPGYTGYLAFWVNQKSWMKSELQRSIQKKTS